MMRWEDVQFREKIAVVAGGAALVLALLYLLFLHPLLNRRARLQEEVTNRRADLVWMQNSAAEFIRNGGTAEKQAAAASPLKMIDQTVRANHLEEQLKRLEPGTGNEIKVWMEDVVYVDLLHWLRQLTGTGEIAIVRLTVEKSSSPGRVNARLTFTSNGASS